MHILHVLDHFLPLHSGYSFRTASIATEQRRKDWRVSLLTGTKHPSGEALQSMVQGFEVYRTPEHHPLLAKVPILNQYAVIKNLRRRIEEVVASDKPDVIHAHSPCLNGLAAIQVGQRWGIPVVYEMRASWEDAAVTHGTTQEGSIRYRLSRALETMVLRRANHVTTICQGLKKEIARRGISSDKITAIPNAVSLDDFVYNGEKDVELSSDLGIDDAVVLGFIGSFYHYEGLPLLVEALAKIRKRGHNVKLLFAGGGLAEEQLQELTRTLDLQQHVRFVGRVPHAEVSRYYELVDIFVYPRLSTRLTDMVTPLKPLEAMAKGRLVVASDVGGHRELIVDKETGILFPANDSEGLTEAVCKLLDDRAGWSSLRRRAKTYVEQQRTWATSVANYEHVYRSARAAVP